MRLINTKSLKLAEFFDNQTPPYAILSHRWEGDEVSYQDYLERKNRKGQGYAKILNFCKKALEDGYGWGWVDTCCIDKKSSAELSESINAMFRWYQQSRKCYVYLSDVEMVRAETGRSGWPFESSKWFTRGWTLQELLAPPTLVFHDDHWHELGRRFAMLDRITAATKIPTRGIRAPGKFQRCAENVMGVWEEDEPDRRRGVLFVGLISNQHAAPIR